MVWHNDPKSHGLAASGIEIKDAPSPSAGTIVLPPSISGQYVNLNIPPSELLRQYELKMIKPAMRHKRAIIPVSHKCKMYVFKPAKGTGLPLSPEFIKQYFLSFIPEEDRKGIKKIVLTNYIKNSLCEKRKCLAEYVPPDTILIYYQTINPNGTYGSFGYTREEYIVRLLFDVLPHEIGHKVDCERYTKRTKKPCIPNDMHERSARAYAEQFRKKWKLPDAWYYETNRKPETYFTPLNHAIDIYKKSMK